MLVLPTHASGVDLSVARGLVDSPGPVGELTAHTDGRSVPFLLVECPEPYPGGRMPQSPRGTSHTFLAPRLAQLPAYLDSGLARGSVGHSPATGLVHPTSLSGADASPFPGLPVYGESQAMHPPCEPNAQPPISSLSTAITASLPIIQYPYAQRQWFASRSETRRIS